jgi:hypothetical protein
MQMNFQISADIYCMLYIHLERNLSGMLVILVQKSKFCSKFIGRLELSFGQKASLIQFTVRNADLCCWWGIDKEILIN